MGAPATTSQIFPTNPHWFHHLQIGVAAGAGESGMLLAIHALSLDHSQSITLLPANFDLLAVNEVSSLCNFMLSFLAAHFRTFLIINLDVNEFTCQHFIEKARRHFFFVKMIAKNGLVEEVSVSKNHSQDGIIYAAVPVVGLDTPIDFCLGS